jgi:hypothetical protein
MNINCETKYNKGDVVYYIEPMYEDALNGLDCYQPAKVVIQEIKVTTNKCLYNIGYFITNHFFASEEDLFPTKEDAQTECDKRNNNLKKGDE